MVNERMIDQAVEEIERQDRELRAAEQAHLQAFPLSDEAKARINARMQDRRNRR